MTSGDTWNPAVEFIKAQAHGNDFLIVEECSVRGRHAAMAVALCNRHTGIGADGIEFLERRPNGGDEIFFLRLFNGDGSEAELSGNGTRCVAAWLAASEGREEVTLGTSAGQRRCRVIGHTGKRSWQIETSMGVPQVSVRKIELERVPGVVEAIVVDMGNPHLVIFTEAEDFSVHGMSWQLLGEEISKDPTFPNGTNVEFVRLLGPDRISFRIYERGCGPTLSSGTGTSAASAAAIAFRGTERTLTAEAEGGSQRVQWSQAENELMLTGSADLICRGVATL